MSISVFRRLLAVLKLLWAIDKVVSSAYSVDLRMFEQLGRSLMNKRKKIGPSMLPWGTPIVIAFSSDSYPLMETY